MPLRFSGAMVSHISSMVVEVTARPEKFGGASLGAVMERIELNL